MTFCVAHIFFRQDFQVRCLFLAIFSSWKQLFVNYHITGFQSNITKYSVKFMEWKYLLQKSTICHRFVIHSSASLKENAKYGYNIVRKEHFFNFTKKNGCGFFFFLPFFPWTFFFLLKKKWILSLTYLPVNISLKVFIFYHRIRRYLSKQTGLIFRNINSGFRSYGLKRSFQLSCHLSSIYFRLVFL
jgi:hypothetical protein